MAEPRPNFWRNSTLLRGAALEGQKGMEREKEMELSGNEKGNLAVTGRLFPEYISHKLELELHTFKVYSLSYLSSSDFVPLYTARITGYIDPTLHVFLHSE